MVLVLRSKRKQGDRAMFSKTLVEVDRPSWPNGDMRRCIKLRVTRILRCNRIHAGVHVQDCGTVVMYPHTRPDENLMYGVNWARLMSMCMRYGVSCIVRYTVNE